MRSPESVAVTMPRLGVTNATMIFAVLFAIAATAAVMLAIQRSALPTDGSKATAGSVAAPRASVPEEPLVQRDTVNPEENHSGTVYYPVPYAAPPNLKLTTGKRKYIILAQNESSFSWQAKPLPEDFREEFKNDAESLTKGHIASVLTSLKPNLQFEEFTWEAKGMRAGSDPSGMNVFEQKGTFQTIINTEGQENFPIPYASPPNVTLAGTSSTVAITECTTTGFRWKNGGDNAFFYNGSVTWTARGIRATEVPAKAATP